ncbi:Uu.00g104360.m01.CDS01 [Anthostomella pinea]|uniref:methionyl-tRNA formyltransferase n=1 Tax=Anthostomella pinea TaxID=933095 RepID=A0AAI8YFP3_9PEZI|nr:Uu.00g104360.m01.CDS01 [Anthostomella pinea]
MHHRALNTRPRNALSILERLLYPCTHNTRPIIPVSEHCHRTWTRRSYASASASAASYEATHAKKTSGPLHILFCGSDEFSCASLAALHAEHARNPDLIRSIEVVVRPGKRTGRGYKVVKDPPVRTLAFELGMQIHVRDTFTGWNMPPNINLIIAVSFGLFVPPRLLKAAKYGGLNLHPSLLPDLRGPAPLQHTLLAARTLTGVTLQTLDHATFDHGLVLAQTPADPADPAALRIPPHCRTVEALQALVTPAATKLLVSGLRDALHVPPLVDRGWKPPSSTSVAAEDPTNFLIHAPKIGKRDAQITRTVLRAEDASMRPENGNGSGNRCGSSSLARRQVAIGPLWFWARDTRGQRRRIIVQDADAEFDGAELRAERGPLAELSEIPAALYEPGDDGGGGGDGDGAAADRAWSVPGRDPETGKLMWRRSIVLLDDEEEGRVGVGGAGGGLRGDEAEQGKGGVGNGGEEEGAGGTGSTQKPVAHLVLWSPWHNLDSYYIGGCRLLRLKVEGDKGKPPALALAKFLVPPEGEVKSGEKLRSVRGRSWGLRA